MALISCKELQLGYDNKPVAEKLTFDVRKGEYLAIVGENGAGKSTLMKTILGLLRPLSGEIVLGDGLKRTEIGYLPQQTIVQKDFPASVWEVVASGCLSGMGLRPFYNKRERALIRDSMEKMGLNGLEKRSYRELSGGQQQRVLLARALCATRKIIFLDEPVSGLDPVVTGEMYELIEKLNKEGTAVVMISHDVSGVLRYADTVLHVGKKGFYGKKEEYVVSGAYAGGEGND